MSDYTSVSWTGGPPTWRASGYWICWGPQLHKYCMTKRGARFGAWRRRRNQRSAA